MNDFAAYIQANWLNVARDAVGWYVTSDPQWTLSNLRAEGWDARATGFCTLMPDDSFRTYFEVETTR